MQTVQRESCGLPWFTPPRAHLFLKKRRRALGADRYSSFDVQRSNPGVRHCTAGTDEAMGRAPRAEPGVLSSRCIMLPMSEAARTALMTAALLAAGLAAPFSVAAQPQQPATRVTLPP